MMMVIDLSVSVILVHSLSIYQPLIYNAGRYTVLIVFLKLPKISLHIPNCNPGNVWNKLVEQNTPKYLNLVFIVSPYDRRALQ